MEKEIWLMSWKRSVAGRFGLIVLSMVLGTLASCGEMIRSQGAIFLTAAVFVHGVFYAVAAFVFVLIMERAVQWLSCESDVRKARHISFGWNSFGWFQVFLIIMLFWTPYLLALYPGVMWYDTGNQLLQLNNLPNLFTDGQMTDHHPVFDTMIFGLFVRLGNVLGSGDWGIFLYSIVQSLVTASVMSFCIIYMRRIGSTYRLCALSLVFVSLFPIFPMYSSAMVKDSLFLPVFMLFCIQCVEIVRSRGEILGSVWFWCSLIAISLLLALTKKTGVYIAIFIGVLMLVVVRSGLRKRMVTVIAIVGFVMMILLPKVVFPVCDIAPGGKQEMLSVPFQQSARLVRDHGEDIPSEQREIIELVLGDDVAIRYVVTNADSVKGFVWDSSKDKYLPEYVKAWFQGLLEHPWTYIEAFLGMESSWITLPNADDENVGELLMPVYAQGTDHSFFEGHEKLGLTSSGTAMAHRIEHVIDWLERTPVGMVIFSRAIWTTWLASFLVYECLRRLKKDGAVRMLSLSPIVISYCSLWISPVSGSVESMRYMVPQVYAMPLAFAVLIMVCTSKSRSDVTKRTISTVKENA